MARRDDSMILTREQTRVYWIVMESIWMRSDQYRPYMNKALVLRAISILAPETTIYDAWAVADALFQAGFIKE